MKLAKVIGTVVCSQKVKNLEGLKILLIQPLDGQLMPAGDAVAAIDTVQAGEGDLVYFTLARESTLALPYPSVPVDAAITGLVDQVHLDASGIANRTNIFEEDK